MKTTIAWETHGRDTSSRLRCCVGSSSFHSSFSRTIASLVAIACALGIGNRAQATTIVTFDTVLGSFDVQLDPEAAPATVENFLNYVKDGDYVSSIIHRNLPGFIIQGGGFTFDESIFGIVPTDPPVINEFQRSNVRGTIAMAKLGDDPDSATSQWFINLNDNTANLDSQNGGFTVFGEVIDDGMDVVDAIAAVPTFDARVITGAFGNLPLRDFDGSPITSANLVVINRVVRAPSTPASRD